MNRTSNCPKCKQPHWLTIETDARKNYTRRRKECQGCGHRWTTYEISQADFKRHQEVETAISTSNVMKDLYSNSTPQGKLSVTLGLLDRIILIATKWNTDEHGGMNDQKQNN